MAIDATTLADWKHVEKLYNAEKDSVVKIAPLTFASVQPTKQQRQNVKLVTKVIDDRTIVSLEATNPKPHSPSVSGTINMLKLVNKWWKIVNVQTSGESARFNDEGRQAIKNATCATLATLKNLGESFKAAKSGIGRSRIRCLTNDTKQGLVRSTMGLHDLAIHLIEKRSFHYVLLGSLQSDRLEGEFGCYRAMSGANLYITAKDVDSAFKGRSLALLGRLGEINIKEMKPDHTCDDCAPHTHFEADDILIATLDKSALTLYERNASVYIAGWLMRVCPQMPLESDTVETEDTEFLAALSRGELVVPSQDAALWVELSVVFMNCRNPPPRCCKHLANAVDDIAVFFNLTVIPEACQRLATVLLAGVHRRDADLRETEGRKHGIDDKITYSVKLRRISGQ